MIKKHLIFNLSYALNTILVLISVYAAFPIMGYIFKTLVHLLLLGFLFFSTKLRGRFHQRLFTGLVFALTGATLFMLRDYNASYFLFGLVSFLICHLFFISAFYLDFLSAKELDKKGARVAIVVSAIFFTSLYLYLRSHLGEYRLPILAYIIMVAVLTMMAAFRNKRVNTLSFNFVLLGVLFIIAADAALAQAHFIKAFLHADFVVAICYLSGQYLIITGGVNRSLIHTQTAV